MHPNGLGLEAHGIGSSCSRLPQPVVGDTPEDGSVVGGMARADAAVVQWNSALKTFFDRLRTRGKPPKVALTAAMHKLLILLNEVMRDQPL